MTLRVKPLARVEPVISETEPEVKLDSKGPGAGEA
jgi:hypothetical protein